MSIDAGQDSEDKTAAEQVWDSIRQIGIITMPAHPLWVQALQAKLKQYETRQSPANGVNDYCILILSHLIENGSCDGHEMILQLGEDRGTYTDELAFLAALNLIDQYARNGFCGGRVLPGLEGIVQIPAEEVANTAVQPHPGSVAFVDRIKNLEL